MVEKRSKEEAANRKRTYVKPQLTEFGDVAKLTRNGFGSGVDGSGQGTMQMMCL